MSVLCNNFAKILLISQIILINGHENVTNIEVSAIFDLRDQLVNVTQDIIFSNSGTDIVDRYLYIIDKSQVYFISFYNLEDVELKSRLVTGENSAFSVLQVDLDRGLKLNEQYTLKVRLVCAHRIQPAARKREISDDQLMQFDGNLHFLSPFKTLVYTAQYKLSNSSIVEISQFPHIHLSDRIVYKFENLQPYSHDSLKLVFVNNKPFIAVKSLERTISISHYGMIWIEDKVVIENTGSHLTGAYEPRSKEKAVQQVFYAYLPASARDIKFFDILGNNSETTVRYFRDYVKLIFKTRYPLYGGWKTSYTLQYQVPTYEYLYQSSDNFVLKIRAIDYVLGQIIESATVNIVLPEGGKLKEMVVPDKIIYVGDDLTFSDFCMFGKQVLKFESRFLLEQYIDDITVEYKFNQIDLLRAPVVIIVYIQLFFFLGFFINHVF